MLGLGHLQVTRDPMTQPQYGDVFEAGDGERVMFIRFSRPGNDWPTVRTWAGLVLTQGKSSRASGSRQVGEVVEHYSSLSSPLVRWKYLK